MKLFKHIPNALTVLNLVSGCFGIWYVMGGQLPMAVLCILLSAVLDFFDGFAARLLHVQSAIGKDLDSLADVISFGALPGFMVVNALKALFIAQGLPASLEFLTFAGFLVPAFSALRLAKFNNDPDQAYHFKGLPTPANALIISGIVLSLRSCEWMSGLVYMQKDSLVWGQCDGYLTSWIANFYVLLAIVLVLSFLLVSNIKLIALKFKSFSWAENKYRILLVVASLVAIAVLRWESTLVILLLYMICSFLNFKSHEV